MQYSRPPLIRVLKKLSVILLLLWLSFGTLLLIASARIFLVAGKLLSPNAVGQIFVTVAVHLGIPAVALYFLLREKGSVTGKKVS